MDPYLERDWSGVHARLIVYAADQLNEQLPGDLCADIERGVQLIEGGSFNGEGKNVRPDVAVSRQEAMSSKSSAAVLAVPLTEPIIVDSPDAQRFIQITDRDGRVVTAVEILSPSNKDSRGQLEYVAKRRRYKAMGANLVEVDLIADDHDVIGGSERIGGSDGIGRRMPYRVSVWRASRPSQYELYPIDLSEPLPNVAIPLRSSDGDVAMALQPLLDRTYRAGRWETTDYRQPPPGRFNSEQLAWMDERLRAAGRR